MLLPLQLSGLDEEQIVAADSLMRAKLEANYEATRDTLSKMETWKEKVAYIMNDTWHSLLHFGIRLLIVIAIFVVGRWLIRRLLKTIDKIFEKRNVDLSLRTFVKSMINIILYLVLFYIIIAYLGVNTSLFVALFAAAGLAIGMALSGTFQNFAGGVMILLLKPFRVGDWIEAQGQSGTVMDIRLFNTILRTSDNKTILLPNGSVSTSIVNNYNVARTRRVEWIISLEYGTDFDAVQKVLLGLVKGDKRVLSTPEPVVYLGNLGTSSVDITVRCWVKSGDFWGVFYDLNALIYKTLPEKGFSFPFSQLDVNLRTTDSTPQGK